MIEIELKNRQSGYDVIEDYIRRYWKHNNSTDTVICSIEVSYDGLTYALIKEVACPRSYNRVEFLNDWWEGEKYIKLIGIKSIYELDISGGVYE